MGSLSYFADIIYPAIFFTDIVLISAFVVVYGYYDEIIDLITLNRKMALLLTRGEKLILEKYFPYYRVLPHHFKTLFEERVIQFILTKEYAAAEPMILTKKMQILIAAYAAQLSFGFRDFRFKYIQEIEITYDKFYSDKFKRHKTWEITDDGVLRFSWKHFYHDLRTKKEITPVGLRIMANAVKHEHLIEMKKRREQSDKTKFYDLPNLNELGLMPGHLFTKRDLSSRENFLAACLIYFHTKRDEFHNQYPDLFNYFNAKLYGQLSEAA